jgi:hypothetical protein
MVRRRWLVVFPASGLEQVQLGLESLYGLGTAKPRPEILIKG